MTEPLVLRESPVRPPHAYRRSPRKRKKEMTLVFLCRVYLPNSSLPGGVKSVKLERARVPNRVYKCVCLLLVSRPT